MDDMNIAIYQFSQFVEELPDIQRWIPKGRE